MKQITDHDRLLAREVINEACRIYAISAESADLPELRDEVMNRRWCTGGGGGVTHANIRTQRAVRAAIREFYDPGPIRERNA